MNGYTIENSIDLLEKDVKALKQGGGGGGVSNWGQLQNKPFDTLGEEFHNLDGALTIENISSDKIALPDSEHYNWETVSEAVEGMNEELGHINGDIIDLTTELNSLDETKQDTLTPGEGINITNNVISSVIIYSYEEQIIGKWVDNKTLYQKTIDFGALPNSTTKDINHNIQNVDTIWVYDGYAKNIGNNFVNMLSLNPPVNPANGWYCGVDQTKIRIQTESDRHDYRGIVTVRYTKTTS